MRLQVTLPLRLIDLINFFSLEGNNYFVVFLCARRPAAASKVFQIILEKIKEFDIGHYVISHKVGESSLTVYQSRDPPGEATSEQGKLPELVPARHWDLHASQKEAGASTQHIPYIPKRWAGPSTQIPFTFVPRKAKRKMFSHVCRTFSRTGVCTKLDVSGPFSSYESFPSSFFFSMMLFNFY